jgi:hypothetical protein
VKEHVLFTWQWWVQFFLFIVPIIIWFRFRKKESTGRLLYAGTVALLILSWLDFGGNCYGLWYYAYKLIPFLPPFIPWETLIVVQIMALLQYKPNVSPWVKAIGLGLFNAFIGEPIVTWMGIYTPVHWSCFYSFPIYLIVYLIAHYLVRSEQFVRL